MQFRLRCYLEATSPVLTPAAIIDDEILIIENGGEMPEVILHGCLDYLRMDREGPQLTLSLQDMRRLKLAVVEGYRKIIMRDLTLENRGKGHYRGLARSIVNFQRLTRFCQQEEFDIIPVMEEVCLQFQLFMVAEYTDVSTKGRHSCINCSVAELGQFCTMLGFDAARLPTGWQGIVCRDPILTPTNASHGTISADRIISSSVLP